MNGLKQPAQKIGTKRAVIGATLVAMWLAVGCAGDTPHVLMSDVERAFSRGDFELLERRVDVDAVTHGYGNGVIEIARSNYGQGFLASMAIAEFSQEVTGLIAEFREEYAEARRTQDGSFLAEGPSLISAHLEEVGGAFRIRIIFDDPVLGGMRAELPLAKRDGRWFVVGLEGLQTR